MAFSPLSLKKREKFHERWNLGSNKGNLFYLWKKRLSAYFTYLTEQQRQPFLNSSHSSYNSPAWLTARDFSRALPGWRQGKLDQYSNRKEKKISNSDKNLNQFEWWFKRCTQEWYRDNKKYRLNQSECRLRPFSAQVMLWCPLLLNV